MIRVVGIRFQQDGKMLYYNAGELTPRMGDYVVAETNRGHDLGEVIFTVHEMEEDQVQSSLPALVRVATQQDIQQATDNRAREREAYLTCQRKIAEHKLEMKLVSVESTFDNSKMMFYFTANGRVDFRALVKDLASTFKTRIELRQIGVRDEARMLGGLGPCGRPICCGAFLSDFQPVSIKMAKEQNLSLNPTKISGVCGRLMCCLKYEQDQYEATRKRMPRVGREVITPDGPGTVADLNVVKETVSVRIPTGDTAEIRVYPLEQISRPGAQNAASTPGSKENERAATEANALSMEVVSNEAQEPVSMEQEGQVTEEAAPRRRPPKKPRNEKQNSQRFGPRPEKGEHEVVEEGKKQASNRPPKNRNNNQSKPRPNREQKFGQPVRRENPDREKKATMNGQPAEENNTPKATTPKAGKGWADAVNKALESAES